VKDAAGTYISDAVVRLVSAVSSSETLTNSNGYYIFPDLNDQTYTITPLKAGFNFFPASKDVPISGYFSSDNNFTGLARTVFSDLNNKPNNIKPVNNLFTPGMDKTTIYYKTAKNGRVIIKLYTLDGRFVKTLMDGDVAAGNGSVEWNGLNSDNSTVASGVYLVQITAPDYKSIKKICVIR
jgi:hypothetical protein